MSAESMQFFYTTAINIAVGFGLGMAATYLYARHRVAQSRSQYEAGVAYAHQCYANGTKPDANEIQSRPFFEGMSEGLARIAAENPDPAKLERMGIRGIKRFSADVANA